MLDKQIPLVDLLSQLQKEDARAVILLLMTSVVRCLKEETISIKQAENIIFNLDLLLYFDKTLDDPQLKGALEYGMQLTDVERLVEDPNEVGNACLEIENLLKPLLP